MYGRRRQCEKEGSGRRGVEKRRGGDADDEREWECSVGGKTWSNEKKHPGAGRTHLPGRQSLPSSVHRANLMRGVVRRLGVVKERTAPEMTENGRVVMINAKRKRGDIGESGRKKYG